MAQAVASAQIFMFSPWLVLALLSPRPCEQQNSPPSGLFLACFLDLTLTQVAVERGKDLRLLPKYILHPTPVVDDVFQWQINP